MFDVIAMEVEIDVALAGEKEKRINSKVGMSY